MRNFPTPQNSIRSILLAQGLTPSTRSWANAYHREYRARNPEDRRATYDKYRLVYNERKRLKAKEKREARVLQ